MCGRGGNCDGSCEATAVHRHVCEACGDVWPCVELDCPDDGWLCDEHANYEECDGCGLWFPMADLDGCLCEPCNAKLLPFDEAHPERPRGI